MGDTAGSTFDVAALLVVVPAVCVLVAVLTVALRKRRLDTRRQRSRGVKIRLDVIRRDLDRLAEYVGGLPKSEPAVRQPFELGLAAMAACQWDQAIEHFQRAQAKASGAQRVPLYNQTGVCHYVRGRLDDALRDFEESVRLAKQYGDAQGKAPALGNIGVISHDNWGLDRALKRLEEALAIARESGDQRAMALYLNNIGNVHRDKGRLDKALNSHEAALAMSRRIGDKPGVVSSLGSIGSIRLDKGELDRAFEYYAEALETAKKAGYRLGAAVELGNIGSVHRDKGELDKALKYHGDAVALAREVGYQVGVATELGNIGLILTKEETYEQAVPKLAESLTILLATGVSQGPRQALFGLSKCDDGLGRKRMQELLKEAGLADGSIADLLDRIDQIRRRRPW